ncbi:thiamine pyrophosphate protein TPP binding domain protein [Catenulispora acidiphila DSM 44928]|uniref:Thiamine pyrophosphate protein TPP binding domain protein n=1 Tax=Catenulispora acidiphila (strain DSM 44928 / JCM 14897 / NBRC 102108 / NRRL B-24433 / ID139908) TaxID=479433 RepID=C7Q7T5_CATAD|nr:thiamine pyrophosphate-dependent enzyme [Catenulispora acidiphila]ACU72278.1 thiamine pyrophosphate protein TPP binding domain protein [Catenulispora acidiphila DSM 44928]
MTTVAEQIVTALADLGVRTVWGVVGDALNPVTDAIRREERIEWIGTRHEEAAAFAASAQAQLSGTIGVCMGTVGPGSLHLLNGLYDAKKSHAPVLAICGQVPSAELGAEYFQEVDNDAVFRDVAAFRHTVTSASQMPRVLEQAVQTAYATPGVSVLTLPGDIGSAEVAKDSAVHITRVPARLTPDDDEITRAVRLLDDAKTVTMLVGAGARESRASVLQLADRLAAPMVLTLKAKEGLEDDNPFQIGQSGLIGNPATREAFESAGALLMIGTDFPYPDWLPRSTPTVQIDTRAGHIGRRTPVDVGVVGDAGLSIAALLNRVRSKDDRSHLEKARSSYEDWQGHQRRLTDPEFDQSLVGKVRSWLDNTEDKIRPEALATLIDTHAAEDTVFTTDTGMSTVWLARCVTMRGSRRLIGSFNLGSMANALPHALGAAALDRQRQVVAFCGDGGLTMLLGDVLTAVAYDLPVKLIVFDNGRLGMVKLEQEQGGLPEFGTELANPDLAAVATAMGMPAARVTEPEALEAAVQAALASPGPYLLDVVTNPEEIALPPKTSIDQAWGFAIAKMKEGIVSRGAKS